jgi:hypothetical protein
MMRYAHDLKSPITMLHMLGIILPILGLVILPLISALITNVSAMTKMIIFVLFYNIFLPIAVFAYGMSLLSKRPTGYGESEVKISNKGGPFFLAFLILLLFLVIGLSPIYLHSQGIDFEIVGFGKFIDYRGNSGPYGTGALMLSLFIPFGIALALGIYYKLITKNLIKMRNETIKLEKEFGSSLFQLGNRVGDGIPTELAFSNVAETMGGTPTGNFFRLVYRNISELGMSIKEAIFSHKVGAILKYPSGLIKSSMEVLIEASRKGPKVVAQSMTTLSNYVSKIHDVNERLKDLLADVISSMKSQVSFLAPLIAGIVVGIASMIVNVLGKLETLMENAKGASLEPGMGFGALEQFRGILNISAVIPSYHFQLIVGIYVIEIVIILTILTNGIENGIDKLNEKNSIGKNLIWSSLLYSIVAFLVIFVFNLLAETILKITA